MTLHHKFFSKLWTTPSALPTITRSPSSPALFIMTHGGCISYSMQATTNLLTMWFLTLKFRFRQSTFSYVYKEGWILDEECVDLDSHIHHLDSDAPKPVFPSLSASSICSTPARLSSWPLDTNSTPSSATANTQHSAELLKAMSDTEKASCIYITTIWH